MIPLRMGLPPEDPGRTASEPSRSRLARLLLPADPVVRRRRDRILALLAILCPGLLVARAVLLENQAFGARFLAGEDPYFDPARGRRGHGPYPPSYALLCAPLSQLPTPVARPASALLQCSALTLTYVLLRRRTRLTWPALAPHVPVLFALALLLVIRFLLRDMAAGGGNLLYGTLAFAGLELALAGRERLAGLPIALGLVLKPNLALQLVFHPLRGRARTVLASALVAAFLFAVPVVWTGAGRYVSMSRTWAAAIVAYAGLDDLHDSRQVPEGLPPAGYAMNQSLREAVHRLLRPPGDSGAADVHVALVPPAAAAWVARGLSLVLLLLCALATLRARDSRREWLAAMAFLPLCLLLSPVTWKAHHVVLLPALFGLCAETRASGSRALAAFLVVYYLACDLLSQEVVGKGSRTSCRRSRS